jgi:hypothetical protein
MPVVVWTHRVFVDEVFVVGGHQFKYDGDMIHDMNTGMQFDRTCSLSVGKIKFKADVLFCNGDCVYLRFDNNAPMRTVLIEAVVSFNLGGHFYTVENNRVTMTGITNSTGEIKLVKSYSFGEHSMIDMPGSHRFVDGILTVGEEKAKLIFP